MVTDLRADPYTGLRQTYTMKEFAQILDYHPVYVRSLVSKGKLEATRTPNGGRLILLHTLVEWARKKGHTPEGVRAMLLKLNDLF